jgi:hypothetical protein
VAAAAAAAADATAERNAPSDIRSVILDVAVGRAAEILAAPAFAVPRLEGAPVLTVRLLRCLYAVGPGMGKYRCPDCGRTFEAVIPSGGTCRCLLCGYRPTDWSRGSWDRYKVLTSSESM